MLRNRKLMYKILISVIFGLLGFWANFYALDFVQLTHFKVSILFGLLFPLLIALSWGWRYGLLSALVGGCQSMWWLWYTDGYGFLYAVPVFTVWVVWHGFWADFRRAQKRKWYYSQYVVEIGFRALSLLGFYTIFGWLVSFNPPPWAPELTQNIVPYSWVHFVVVKHIIVAYILLLFCHVFLHIGFVRRFFMLEEETDHTEKSYIISASILVGALFWAVHSFADYFVFYRGENLFLDLMITNIPPSSLFTRNLVFVICLVVGVILARLLSDRKKGEEKIKHLNLVLKAIRNVNQLVVTERDRDRLIQCSCDNLTETRGYYNSWIVLLDETGRYVMSAESGLGKDFLPMVDRLKQNDLTLCGRNALSKAGVVVTENPVSDCADCPLSKKYAGRSAMTIRLENGGKIYGILSISISKDFVLDEEEQGLFEEVAGDIAFALHGIEMEENRKLAEEEIKRSLREKVALLAEIHHRVKNNMQIIISLLSLQSEDIADERALSLIRNCEDRIKSMSLVHEKLYLSEDLSKIDFSDYVESMATRLLQTCRVNSNIVNFSSHIEDVLFNIETAIPLGLIINELISNSMKHAFPEGRKGNIAVELTQNTKTEEYTLTVTDDGIGFSEEIDCQNTETFGMQLVDMLTEQLHGTVELDRSKGTSFKITFKEQKYKKRI